MRERSVQWSSKHLAVCRSKINEVSSWREEGEGVFIPLSQKLAVTAKSSGSSGTCPKLPDLQNFRIDFRQIADCETSAGPAELSQVVELPQALAAAH